MPDTTKLQGQTTAEDAALIETHISYSAFVPRGHRATTDFGFQEKRLYTSTPIIQSGQEIVFDIDKEGTLLDEDISLCFTAPSLTGVVTGAPTYARYGDFGGYQCLSSTDPQPSFEYGSSNVHRVWIEDMFSKYNFKNNEKKKYIESLVGGELSAAERNTLALAPQQYRVKVTPPWEGCGNQLPICALANKLRLRFKFAPASQAIQTDGVKPASINYTDVYLRYRLVHMPGMDREALAADTFREKGRFTLFSDVAKYEHTIPANAMFTAADPKGYPIDLKDITGTLRHLCVLLRESTALDASGANPTFYEINPIYLNNLTFQITANDRVLFEPTRPNYEQVEQLEKLYDCTPNINQLYAWWDLVPDDVHFAAGHITLANYTGAKLWLRSAIAHPELRGTLLASRWNWTNQKNGNYQRIWN